MSDQISTTEQEKRLKYLKDKYNKYKKSPKLNNDGEEVFCICRKIDDGELMVACDGCDEWYHFSCVKLNTNFKDLVNNYYCPFCDELLHKGKSIWKKKCRLDYCFKPIKIDKDTGKGSKYCCEEHGLEFMRTLMLNHFKEAKVLNDKDRLKQNEVSKIFQESENYNYFKDLGHKLPKFDKPLADEDKQEMQLKISNIDAKIQSLTNSKHLYTTKLRYLHKLREKIKLIDEILTNEDGENHEDQENPKKSKKKSKKGKKIKKTKIDICGFDSNLQLHSTKWNSFTKTEEYQTIVNFNGSFEGVTNEQVRAQYKSLKGEDEDQDEEGDAVMSEDPGASVFGKLCINDKKKCTRHLTWYSIMDDNMELKSAEVDAESRENSQKKETMMTDFTIRNWEIWEAEN